MDIDDSRESLELVGQHPGAYPSDRRRLVHIIHTYTLLQLPNDMEGDIVDGDTLDLNITHDYGYLYRVK